MNGLLSALLLVGLGLGMPEPAAAQLTPETEARLDSIFADFDRTDGPGCALGVVRDGRLAYAKGYGIAHLDYRRPISPNTTFYLASVSKQFTAAAVVLAERQGHLSLDDPVREWIPDLPNYKGRTITLNHLLHHTSGLRDYDSLAELAAWDDRNVHETEDYLNLIYRQEALNFPPGTEYQYSNTNYLLLAEVLEAATGSTLREFAEENLFAPLGMRNTHFHDDRTHVVRNRAVGYAPAEHGFKMIHRWNSEEVGAGGVYASIEDLARWDRNFDIERVGGDGFTEQMTTRGVLVSGDTLGYAFGLGVGTYRGQRTVGHEGGNPGFRTHYLRFPEAGRSIIVLCNSESPDVETQAYSVADVILEGRLAPRNISGESPKPSSFRPTSVSGEILDRLVGRYKLNNGNVVLTFTREGRTLHGLMPGRSKTELIPTSDSTFSAEGVGISVTFHRGPSGPADSLTMHRPESHAVARRIGDLASWTPSREDRTAFEGRYHSDELGVDYQIVTGDEGLQLQQGDRAPKPLRPRKKGTFTFDERGGRIQFIRGNEGRVNGLEVSTPQAKGIRFERNP